MPNNNSVNTSNLSAVPSFDDINGKILETFRFASDSKHANAYLGLMQQQHQQYPQPHHQLYGTDPHPLADSQVAAASSAANMQGGDGANGGKGIRPISPAIIQCGITDEELVTLSVRDLNRALKMRGLTRDEIVTMKQR